VIGLFEAVYALGIGRLEGVCASAFDNGKKLERCEYDLLDIGKDDTGIRTTINLIVMLLTQLTTGWIIRELCTSLQRISLFQIPFFNTNWTGY
jgi:hypothetical protein